jgi:hypothetical protein
MSEKRGKGRPKKGENVKRSINIAARISRENYVYVNQRKEEEEVSFSRAVDNIIDEAREE